MSFMGFIEKYGANTLIIAIISSVFQIALKKITKGKTNNPFVNYSHILFAVVLELVYDMTFIKHSFVFSEGALYSGIIAGSFATVITVIVGKIKRGEKVTLDALLLLIEGLLDGYVDEKLLASVSVSIAKIVKDSSKTEENVGEEIVKELKVGAKKNLTEEELKAVATVLLKTTEKFNK